MKTTINEMSETVILWWKLYWNTEQRLADGQAVVELLHVVHTETVTCSWVQNWHLTTSDHISSHFTISENKQLQWSMVASQ